MSCELLNCPFCGYRAELASHGFNQYSVECLQCGATRGRYSGMENAISAWNNRSPLSDPTPLTPDQLLELIGEPIWISRLDKWGILSGKLVDVDKGETEYRLIIGFEYGWEWLDDVLRGDRCAYTHKPKDGRERDE